MQTSSFEAMWPIMGKISWRRNYEAMLAAPLSVRDLVFGEMGWMAFRLTTVSFAFLTVLTLFGIPSSPLAILAWPAAVLTGLAFFADRGVHRHPEERQRVRGIFRFVINPLFLFSGTFFPVDRLPDAIEFIAALTRCTTAWRSSAGSCSRPSELANWPIHLGYLVVFLGIATWLAYRFLYRRLAARDGGHRSSDSCPQAGAGRHRLALRARRLVQRNMPSSTATAGWSSSAASSSPCSTCWALATGWGRSWATSR